MSFIPFLTDEGISVTSNVKGRTTERTPNRMIYYLVGCVSYQSNSIISNNGVALRMHKAHTLHYVSELRQYLSTISYFDLQIALTVDTRHIYANYKGCLSRYKAHLQLIQTWMLSIQYTYTLDTIRYVFDTKCICRPYNMGGSYYIALIHSAELVLHAVNRFWEAVKVNWPATIRYYKPTSD